MEHESTMQLIDHVKLLVPAGKTKAKFEAWVTRQSMEWDSDRSGQDDTKAKDPLRLVRRTAAIDVSHYAWSLGSLRQARRSPRLHLWRVLEQYSRVTQAL